MTRRRKFLFWSLYSMTCVIFAGSGVVLGLYLGYGMDLPEVRSLENYQPSVLTEIYGDDNTPIGQFYLERRKLVSAADIPERFKQAVIAIEDKSYYSHFGIDLRRIVQSSFINLWNMRIVRGASTITQQLSKLLFLTPEVSFHRKIKEMLLAIQIERHYSKEAIFTFYANKIYMAHGNYGVASAAEFYFDKPAKSLSLSECALLAAIIKAPNRYSPILHPDKAKNRRDTVLAEMFQDGSITETQMKAAQSEPIKVVGKDFDKNFSGYFIEYVRQYLQRRYSSKQIFTEGLRVFTTLNAAMQSSAEGAVRQGLRDYDRRKGWRGGLENVLAQPGADLKGFHHPDWDQKLEVQAFRAGLVLESSASGARVKLGEYEADVTPESVKWTYKKKISDVLKRGDVAYFRVLNVHERLKRVEVGLEQIPEVQGAFLALESKTGAIKAMVGGLEWEKNKFNRATQAKRQTGSIFKPFVYTAAILGGMSPDDTVEDSPITITDDIGQEYTPSNYDGEFRGTITLRQALAGSINVPAVKVAMEVGIPEVVSTARRFGITGPLHAYPSTALGACEITLLEIVSAFSAFSNDGVRVDPFYIRRIEDIHGSVLEEHRAVTHPVIPTNVARTMVSMLRGVVEYGTAAKARSLNAELAGKTGTTNDFTDTWFCGFTPSLTAGAWVGFDEKKTLGNGETGAKDALPIWILFMQDYLKGRVPERFPTDVTPLAGPDEKALPKPPDWFKGGIQEENLD